MAHKILFLPLIILMILGGVMLLKYQDEFPSPAQNTKKVNAMITDNFINIKDVKTPAGHSVWLTNAELDVVSVAITFRGAGDRSVKQQPGLANFLTRMLTEGAGPYSSQEFKNLLLDKNIQLSVASGKDNIVIYFRTLSSNINDAFELIRLILTNPRFAADDMERIKQQLTADMQQSLYFPETIAREAMAEALFGKGHIYSLSTKEELASLPTITSKDLRKHMQNYFAKDNIQIVAAGNIKEGELGKLIDLTLRDIAPSALKQPEQHSAAKLPQITTGKTIAIEMDVPQTVIYFSQPAIPPTDPDYYALMMLNLILGNTFESRLWNEVREKRGLAYFCSTSLNHRDFSDTISGYTATQTENAEQVIQLITKEWRKLLDTEITQEEFDLQRNNAIGAFPLGFDSTISIVARLADYRRLGLPVEAIGLRNKRIKELTLDDLKRVKHRLIKAENLTFVRVGRGSFNNQENVKLLVNQTKQLSQ